MLTENDFMDIDINLLPARVFCKHIAKWKEDGLPEDFRINVQEMVEQYNLALCFAFGKGVVKNANEAVRYYKLAADQGHAKAQWHMGFCYENGAGVTKCAEDAVHYYKLAADQGQINAQCKLGVCYENGAGVLKDEQEAVRYYKLAADQLDTAAQFCLERIVNKQEAVRPCKHADEQIHTAAEFQIWDVYPDNVAGFTEDKGEAVRYNKFAADQSRVESSYSLSKSSSANQQSGNSFNSSFEGSSAKSTVWCCVACTFSNEVAKYPTECALCE